MIKVKSLKELHKNYGELYKQLATYRKYLSKQMIKKAERTLKRNYDYSLKCLSCNLKFDLKQEMKKAKAEREVFVSTKQGFLKRLFNALKNLLSRKVKQ